MGCPENQISCGTLIFGKILAVYTMIDGKRQDGRHVVAPGVFLGLAKTVLLYAQEVGGVFYGKRAKQKREAAP